MKIYIALCLSFCILATVGKTQTQNIDATVSGCVISQKHNEHIPFTGIYLEGTTIGTTTDHNGCYRLTGIPEGTYVIVAKSLNYTTAKDTIRVEKGKIQEVNFVLKEKIMAMNEVVVTATRTFKRQTESPVIVNILESKSLEKLQACNISEGLRFQPGLRVETDCQTCNYTQLRMNGLEGNYSQILINGRPIFSPLIGLYGMEQIPANMVDHIEVVRGGGSALYGSGAIGGIVNIITKIPKKELYSVSTTTQCINGKANDFILNGNLNVLTNKQNAGASFFINHRKRESYDQNEDNFSELPEIENNSFGANLFFQPANNQKLEINLTSLYEYRYGGEMVNEPAHIALQSEERTHNIIMASMDYQITFNDNSFISYAAGQHTNRDHYTGIYPDLREEIDQHLANPPYGITNNTTLQAGSQFNYTLKHFMGGRNVITLGTEYVFDDVFDTIPAYNYETDQVTKNTGGFVQSDWLIRNNINLLTGIRIDKHNLIDNVIFSPRVSLLYRMKNYMQFRVTWGTGFLAPRAFDADMHMAFAGGGVSRISLAPDLKEEHSNSFSSSVNLDFPTEHYIAGFTIEGFYTKKENAFYLHPIGKDTYGDLFEKRNGRGATVQGATFELRGNYNRQLQLEAGFTIQTSLYEQPVSYIEDSEPIHKFLRTPDKYGYMTLMITPTNQINASLSSVYTGSMKLVHYAGAPEQITDEYITSPPFTEVNAKISYTFEFKSLESGLEIFAGVKNITNAFQDDFDTGKYRDSNYIYGPASPRTFYVGIRLKSL